MNLFQQKINKKIFAVDKLFTLSVYFFIGMLVTTMPSAEQFFASSNMNHVDHIIFVEEEDAACSITGGHLILIQNLSATQTYQVWIDRWYMHVQTPDHTNQILQPNAKPIALGCSIARSGGAQYWTIHSIFPV
jgi:hypothetical protein